MHLWSFMICGHSCRYWWFVRDGFGVQVRLRPRFHRRLAEPTEQLDHTLRRIWRSQSSICARRLRRPGIDEDQVSVCRIWCHSDVNSIVFSHSSSVLSFNAVHLDSIPCDCWEGPILRTPWTFDEHLFFFCMKSQDRCTTRSAFCEALSEEIEGTDGDGQEDLETEAIIWVYVCMCVFVQYQAVRSLACDIVDLCSEQIVTNRFWNWTICRIIAGLSCLVPSQDVSRQAPEEEAAAPTYHVCRGTPGIGPQQCLELISDGC